MFRVPRHRCDFRQLHSSPGQFAPRGTSIFDYFSSYCRTMINNSGFTQGLKLTVDANASSTKAPRWKKYQFSPKISVSRIYNSSFDRIKTHTDDGIIGQLASQIKLHLRELLPDSPAPITIQNTHYFSPSILILAVVSVVSPCLYCLWMRDGICAKASLREPF